MTTTTADVLEDDHSRTIVHILLDNFYAVVEMTKNPKLQDTPTAIQHDQLIARFNSKAGECGIKESMTIIEALKVCPKLKLITVNKVEENLQHYQDVSTQVTDIIEKFSNVMEKCGLDEYFVDISELVAIRMNETLVSDVFNENCGCGCNQRLIIGSMIAKEIQEKILYKHKLVSSTGVSYNKLLAKLANKKQKINSQTIVFSNNALQLVENVGALINLPGIGAKLNNVLRTNLKIRTVSDLRKTSLKEIQVLLGPEKGLLVWGWGFGRDTLPVKSHRENRLNNIEHEVEMKFRSLLQRLMVLVADDGRIPKIIKVTLRKQNQNQNQNQNKSLTQTQREQRQSHISETLFEFQNNRVVLRNESAEANLMSIIMRLFHKLVNIHCPFRIIMIGLSFTKFYEQLPPTAAVSASFLMQNLSVQSLTLLENTILMPITPMEPMEWNTNSNSESEVLEIEPSAKKRKAAISKRRLAPIDNDDCPSPSKLRVAELRLTDESHPHSRLHPDVLLKEPVALAMRRIKSEDCSFPQKYRLPTHSCSFQNAGAVQFSSRAVSSVGEATYDSSA